MGKLREKYKDDRSNAAQPWREFESFFEKTQGPLGRVLRNPNPEVVISLLDLLETAHVSEGENWWARAVAEDEHPWDNEPDELKNAKIAIQGLRRCLDDFFYCRHLQDRLENPKSKRQYLAKELSTLRPGDLVLTTNWDTLAERVLLEEMDCWRPRDGYGFNREFELHPPSDRRLPPALLQPSAIRVLKLHGSFGWYEDDMASKRELYLSWARLLQHLPLPSLVAFRDKAEKHATPYDQNVALYPSYLKQLDQPQLREVWSLASKALERASNLHVIGYSLPESDTAIRVLLNPLRDRVEMGKVEILVDDPDPDARKRWTVFLGERVVTRDRRIGG